MQIHLLKSGEVRIFSRNCEDRSQAFPDVATAIRTAADGEPDLTAFILLCTLITLLIGGEHVLSLPLSADFG